MTIFTDTVTKYLPRMMKDLQITKAQAAGIFGNIGTETGGFTALQEIKPVAGRGGFGWFQWTGPRRKKYEQWAKAHNMDPTASETNYQYIIVETTIDEAHSLAQLKKTTTVEAATETFMKQNLRPGKPNLTSRINYAKQAFDTVQEQSKADSKSTAVVLTTVGAATTGAVLEKTDVISSHPHQTWVWVAVGAAIILSTVWYFIHRSHAAETKNSTKG